MIERVLAWLGRLSLRSFSAPASKGHSRHDQRRRMLLPMLGVLPASTVLAQTAAKDAPDSGPAPLHLSTASGAVGNGVADDTERLQLFLNGVAARGGGVVQVPSGVWHYIGSANLTIPSGVILQGASNPFAGWGSSSGPFSGSGLYVSPSYSIVCDVNSSIRRLKIFRAGLLASPTPSQIKSAVHDWAADRSVGIVLLEHKGGNVLEDLFVVGFNTLIKSLVGDFYLNRIFGDGINGLEVTRAGDNHSVSRVRFEPFYGIDRGPGPDFENWFRPGIAFINHDGCTGGFYSECFAFCWKTGYELRETGISYYIGCGWETQVTPAGDQKGYVWIGHNAQVSFHACYANGGEFSWDVQGTGECVITAPSVISSTATALFRLGANSYGAIYNADMNIITGVGLEVQQGAGNWKIVAPLIRSYSSSPWLKIHPSAAGRIEIVSPGVGFEAAAIDASSPIVGPSGGSVLIAPTTGAILSSYPNGTVAGGVDRGRGAVDLQWTRSLPEQVASGAYSAILAGQENRSAGNWSAVLGGKGNSVSGDSAFSAGFKCVGTGPHSGVFGANAGDRGRHGVFAWSSDVTAATAARQHVIQVLAGKTTSALPVQLTADRGAPNTGNCANIDAGFAYKLDISVVANSGVGDAAATWDVRGLLLRRDSRGQLMLFPPPTKISPISSYGAGLGWRIDISADRLNSGINVSAFGDPHMPVEWSATVYSTEVGGS